MSKKAIAPDVEGKILGIIPNINFNEVY